MQKLTKKLIALSVIALSSLTLAACSSDSSATSKDNSQPAQSVQADKSKNTSDKTVKSKVSTRKTSANQPTKSSNKQAVLSKLVSYTNSESAGPTGDYYWNNGSAKLTGFEHMRANDYKFTADSQGRASVAKAVLTYSEYQSSKGSRQGSPLDPYAWPENNPKVAITYGLTGRTYHGYLYNRSHSIGDSLLGSKSYDSANNFTTGTRPQNVGADQNGGMRYAEEMAEDYWSSHPNTKATISYETTPLYEGTETMPRGSVVDIKSSDGSLNNEVVVINSVEGIKVNYDSGASNAKPVVAQKSSTNTRIKSSPKNTTAQPIKDNEWTVAATGKVYVSDSHKYYARVTNPNNYQYMTEQAAINEGATRAKRGNEFARPS